MPVDAAGSVADVISNFWVDGSATADDLTAHLKDVFESLQ